MYILTYDLGTTALKTSLYRHCSGTFHLIDAQVEEYHLTILPGGGAEQDPNEWWEKICISTQAIARRHPEEAADIAGISFCSQMQALVLVDKDGNALRPSMNYIDQRGAEQHKEYFDSGVKISGLNAVKLMKSIKHTGVASASAKDPVWKYLWVKKNEPDVFNHIYKWLDVKEYIAARMTGTYVRSEDTAFASLLVDSKSDGRQWSKEECDMFGIRMEHLPPIVDSAEKVGTLRAQQAEELGLHPGVPVFAGGGDVSLVGVGAGAGLMGMTHIYWGTSGWVSTTVDHHMIDLSSMIASITGAQHGIYNYFGEIHTAGKCFEWVRDHLAKDEIRIYIDSTDVADDPETVWSDLYEYMSDIISRVEPGSGGVLFLPWLQGNRTPFEDAHVRSSFFNIGIETKKTDLIRSVIEGVCLHLRWILEASDRKVPVSQAIRFAGGGALSPVTAQILADVIGRPVETVDSPQNVGGIGAAMVVAVGLGAYSSLSQASASIKPQQRYEPNPNVAPIYDRHFEALKLAYGANKKIFHLLNRRDEK